MPPPSNTPATGDPKGGGDWSQGLREAAPLLGLGMTLAVTVLGGLGAGYWLDGKLGTRPWLLLAGATLGVVSALVYFIKTVSGSSKGKSDPKP